MTKPKTRPVYAVTSVGLWRQRDDLARLLDADITLASTLAPFAADGFVGWGQRKSGLRAERWGRALSKPVILVEDGFLKSYAPGRAEPAHGLVADRTGIYFNARRPSDLSLLIDGCRLDAEAEARVGQAISFLRTHQLSKYNNAPIVGVNQTSLGTDQPYVLLVDQVAGDASIRGALADDSHFTAMVEHAAAHYPDAVLAIRAHPAAGDRSLLIQAARRLGIAYQLPPKINPWPLLERAEAVYTVSSQLGFEALMAGRRVHCFGVSYYSHRGLTSDHCPAPEPRKPASLAQVFHAAYIDYSRYFDLHTREPVSLEHAMDQMLTVRDQRNQIGRRVFTAGLSPWKRRALDPFLIGPAGRARHLLKLSAAIRQALRHDGQIALWGSSRPQPAGVPAIRFEDGFIRSRGLGVNLALPSSLAMDGEHAYYDARGESRLEHIIASHEFPEDLQRRAERLIEMLVAKGISKYNVGDVIDLPEPEAGRLKVLVPGQVEKDASIRYGSPAVRSNAALVDAVRRLYPDAFIVYKEHPDVSSGLRSGGAVPESADMIVRGGDIMAWIGWCDRLETMTSLAGFEALIRGKPVGCHGIPFYAGWGLTDDRLPIARRKRRINRDMLVAAALILYPFYVHPLSALPCSVEELVAEIALNRQMRVSRFRRAELWLMRSINRSAVKIRDGRT